MPADPRLWHPDPNVRLQAWHELATNAGITEQTIDRLASAGFTEAAHGLLAAVGTPAADDHGAFLGRLELWGLDVYQGSPQPWIDALFAEQEQAGTGLTDGAV